MKKIDRIKDFIIKNNPTRKQIVTFIVVDINKLCTLEEYSHKRWGSYYATNFTKWKHNGQTHVDNKGKYSITPEGLKSKKSLYSLTDNIKIKRLENQVEVLRETIQDLRNRVWKAEKTVNVGTIQDSDLLSRVWKAERTLEIIKNLVE